MKLLEAASLFEKLAQEKLYSEDPLSGGMSAAVGEGADPLPLQPAYKAPAPKKDDLQQYRTALKGAETLVNKCEMDESINPYYAPSEKEKRDLKYFDSILSNTYKMNDIGAQTKAIELKTRIDKLLNL